MPSAASPTCCSPESLCSRDENPLKLALRHARDVPRRPSARTDRFITPGLEALVMQCLEKAPAARPPTARAMEEMLASCGVENGPTLTRGHGGSGTHRFRPATNHGAGSHLRMMNVSEPRTLVTHPELRSHHSLPPFMSSARRRRVRSSACLSVFADVRAGEGISTLLLALNIFLLLGGY